jgi:hypothetical protein
MPTKCSNCGSEIIDGLKTCPHCGGGDGGRLHIPSMLGGIVIALCLVTLVGELAKNWISSTGAGRAAESPLEPGGAPVFSVTAHELATAYEANDPAARQRFKNSRFSVTGESVVVLDGGANRIVHPQATLAAAEKAKASSLVSGSPVSLVCTGRGDAVNAPLVNDCVIGH